MRRLIRRAATLVATGIVATAMLPAAGAHAAPISPCDNEPIPVTGPTTIPLPGSLGVIQVQVTFEDTFVRWDEPGSDFDTVVGVDLQNLNPTPTHPIAVCLSLPLSRGIMVTIDPLTLDIGVCTYEGDPYVLASPCEIP